MLLITVVELELRFIRDQILIEILFMSIAFLFQCLIFEKYPSICELAFINATRL